MILSGYRNGTSQDISLRNTLDWHRPTRCQHWHPKNQAVSNSGLRNENVTTVAMLFNRARVLKYQARGGCYRG